MKKSTREIIRLLGAHHVETLPDVGGGAFGAARLAGIFAIRMAPSAGKRPGRPTDASWTLRKKIPMARQTEQKLNLLAKQASTGTRKVSPMQMAAVLLEQAIKERCG